MQSYSEAYRTFFESSEPQQQQIDSESHLAQAAAYKAYQQLKQNGNRLDRDELCKVAEQEATDWLSGHPEWTHSNSSTGTDQSQSEGQNARILDVRQASREQAESLWQLQEQSSQTEGGGQEADPGLTNNISKDSQATPANRSTATREHVAEQSEEGVGGITGNQPFGKIDLKHL